MIDDLIRRQDAIEALDVGAEYFRRVLDLTDIAGVDRENCERVIGLIEAQISDIKELPSAQPEQRWIPCSERLPDIGKPVLISALMPLCMMVYIGYLSDDVWFCDRLFFRSDEVVAWMPLPDAYEEDE